MKAHDLTNPVTTESLQREFQSRFGQTLKVEGMDKFELEDMANMIRTKIHTITDNTHYGKELSDPDYQKYQSMLDIVNQAIKEASKEDLPFEPDTDISDKDEFGNTIKHKAKHLAKKAARDASNRVKLKGFGPDHAKGNMGNPSARAALGKNVATEALDQKTYTNASRAMDALANTVDDRQAKFDVQQIAEILADMSTANILELGDLLSRFNNILQQMDDVIEPEVMGVLRQHDLIEETNEINEGIEQQSELILAAKDMMDKVTGYLETIATMKTESLLELGDRVRDEMGAETAEQFVNIVQPTLEQAEETLGQTRVDLDSAVRLLTGEEQPSEDFGAEDPETDDDLETDLVDDDEAEADEFTASDAEAGGDNPEGREER